jgi:hypothetical protein
MAEDFAGLDALLSNANLDFIATSNAIFERPGREAA